MSNMLPTNLFQAKQKDILLVAVSQSRLVLSYNILNNKEYSTINYLEYPLSTPLLVDDSAPEELATYISAKLKSLNINPSQIHLLIDDSELIFYKLKFPFASKIQISKVMNEEISAISIFDKTRLNFEIFTPLADGKDNYRVLVASMLKFRLHAYAKTFQEFNLNLCSLGSDISLLCLANKNDSLKLVLNKDQSLAALIKNGTVLDYFYGQNLNTDKLAFVFSNYEYELIENPSSEQELMLKYVNNLSQKKQINFIQNNLLPSNKSLEKYIRPIVWLHVAVVLSLLLISFSVYVNTNQKNSLLRQEVYKAYRELMPDTSPLLSVGELANLAKNRLDLWQNNNQVSVQDDSYISLLTAINANVDANINIVLNNLSLSNQALRLTGTTNDFQTVEALRQSLSLIPKLANIQIQSTVQDVNTKNIRFELLANFS